VSVFGYPAAGGRQPFDPLTTGAHLAGCILCGRRIAAVGVFIPTTDEMHAVVMRLREHPIPPRSTSCISYGLCRRHLAQPDVTERVETALAEAADKVRVQ
jgi:hypothetical protein